MPIFLSFIAIDCYNEGDKAQVKNSKTKSFPVILPLEL